MLSSRVALSQLRDRSVASHCIHILSQAHFCLILRMPDVSCLMVIACLATIRELDKTYISMRGASLLGSCFHMGVGS